MLFDWANQPFLALGAFVFAPYLSQELVGDPTRGQALWGYMLASVAIVVALTSPILGAIADALGRRKPFVFAFSSLTVIGAALLWYAEPSRPDAVAYALVLFAIAAVGTELSAVFNNAMLPDLAGPRTMGRLSGLGWGMGYAGGFVALVLVFATLVLAQTPALGLDPAQFEPQRSVGPISALWLAIFLLPFFLFTPDTPARPVALWAAVRSGLGRLVQTARHARKLGNVGRFLLARMLYQDGLSALLNFSGLYGAGVFGWSIETLGLFAILLIVAAVPGSFLGGVLDDRLGSKRTITIAVTGLVIAAIGILSVGPDEVLFVIPVAAPTEGGGLFAATGERAFLGFALLAGLCVGPAQSASRTMLARLAPPDKLAEFFGLYALAGKATAFAAPLLVGLTTTLFASQRPGLAVLIVFLVGGLIVLRTVRL